MSERVRTVVVRVEEGSRQLQGAALEALATLFRPAQLEVYVRYLPLLECHRGLILFSRGWRAISNYRLHLFREGKGRARFIPALREPLGTAVTFERFDQAGEVVADEVDLAQAEARMEAGALQGSEHKANIFLEVQANGTGAIEKALVEFKWEYQSQHCVRLPKDTLFGQLRLGHVRAHNI